MVPFWGKKVGVEGCMAGEISSRRGKYLYNEVVERILEMIRRGELKEGLRMPSERSLALSFGVSRNCIRQAIQTLSERHILEGHRGDGTYVRTPDETALIDSFAVVFQAKGDLIREILEFRMLMEPQIASLAAANITREELDRLKVIVCDQERRILAGKEDSELDGAFHLGLASASKNRIIKQVMDMMHEILGESRSESLWNETRRKASVVGHLKIIDALENKDPDMAFEAMKEHLRSVEKIVLGRVRGEQV
jgi:GntR family transcriptional regulator, transcriptional repressor for pyruvate dehydrogenase complex